jgi:hypothetical protein
MMSYREDELDSIWKKLKDGTECDADFQLDVGEGVVANIYFDTDVDVCFPAAATLNSFNGGGAGNYYTRIRLSKEAPWGMWVEKN